MLASWSSFICGCFTGGNCNAGNDDEPVLGPSIPSGDDEEAMVGPSLPVEDDARDMGPLNGSAPGLGEEDEEDDPYALPITHEVSLQGVGTCRFACFLLFGQQVHKCIVAPCQ